MFIKSFLVAGLLAGGIASPAILLADDNTPDFPVPVQRAVPLDFMIEIDDDHWARMPRRYNRLGGERAANLPCSQLELAAGYGRTGCGVVPM
ncbi:hypothetical protein LCGC14_2307120, partial [marine sediment metagenome]